MDFSALSLSPASATIIFCLTCLAGYRYRHTWKIEGPRLHYWIYGGIAASGLLALGFIPIMPAP
jgi:hypothetical protein